MLILPTIGKCVKLSSLDSEELNENYFQLIGLTVAPRSFFKNKKKRTKQRTVNLAGQEIQESLISNTD